MAIVTRLTRLFRADAHAVLDRLEEPEVLLRQAVRSPRRFAVFVLAGVVAGSGVGFGGPLIGAALGGLAGSAIALSGSPPG